MKGEINLLPRQMILLRERHEYLKGLKRLLQRSAVLLSLLLIGEIAAYFAILFINREISITQGNKALTNVTVTNIQEVNTQLAEFERHTQEQINWSLLVEDILQVVPANITINAIEIPGKTPPEITVSGFAGSQKSVNDFRLKLDDLPWVEKLVAPLQNYALGSGTALSFSFNLFL